MKKTTYALSVASFAIIAATSTTALAQLPESALSTAEPGRVSQELRGASDLPNISSNIQITEARAQGVPANADRINLNLNGLNLQGVTAYTAEELAPLYNGQLGQTITLADVYGIAQAIKLKYRNDGYLLAQTVIPPQTINNGIVDIQIVEGTVDSVVVEGEETKATDLIRRYAAQIADGGALSSQKLERQLLLINDLPGVSARSVLSPSPNLTGATDVRIIVERDPFDAVAGINNYGSRFLGPLQLNGAVSANNFFDLNERLTAQLVVAPEDFYELGYLALSYELPIGSQGTMLELFGSHTDTEPGFSLSRFDVEGQSVFASAQVEHPFIRSRAQNLYGRFSFDWRDVETSNNLAEPTREDNIRAFRAGLRYDFLDTLLGVGVNSIDLELAHGVDLFGASDAGDLNLSRANGEPDFFKANLEFQRLQRVTNNINVLFAGQGQWADDDLLASEEFGVGGMNIGRAFDSSEIVGEKGIAGKVEVQWSEPVQWNMVEDYQLFGFFDAGRIWNGDATAVNLSRETATSTGFGIRSEIMQDINADFTVAIPLNREVQTQGDEDPRFYFSLSKSF